MSEWVWQDDSVVACNQANAQSRHESRGAAQWKVQDPGRSRYAAAGKTNTASFSSWHQHQKQCTLIRRVCRRTRTAITLVTIATSLVVKRILVDRTAARDSVIGSISVKSKKSRGRTRLNVILIVVPAWTPCNNFVLDVCYIETISLRSGSDVMVFRVETS